MSQAIEFGVGQRWLVVAPHPDDEVLGTGGLLQCAVGAGAAIAVALLTDGGNNPWPQRWIERRLKLDHEARERWGQRRRAEAEAALGALGFDAADVLIPLGWPDGEIDRAFAADPAKLVAELGDMIEAFGPTHLVLPGADDTHPDHSAAAAIGTLAARRLGKAPRVFAYRVHGQGVEAPLELALSKAQVERKTRALEAHATQLALSRRRFTARARAPERYFSDPFAGTAGRLRVEREGKAARIELAARDPKKVKPGRHALRIVYADADGALHSQSIGIGEHPGLARFDRAAGTLTATLAGARDAREVFAKIEPKSRGIWIYDSEGWCRA
jgi:LmbE family N-acetylglucosaminyl deacetylase